MVVVFASNLTLVVLGGVGTVSAFSDPVPLGDADRASAALNAHQMDKTAGTLTLTYIAQVSNDGGQNFTNVSSMTDSVIGVSVANKVGAVNGALLRFKYTLTLPSVTSADIGVACFDLHVKLDHAYHSPIARAEVMVP